MKKLIVMSVVSLLLASPVAAQTGKSEPTTNSGSTGATSNVPLDREAVKTKVIEKREEAKDKAVEKREAVKNKAIEKREEVKTRALEKREEVKLNVGAKREEVKANIDAKREEFKAKVEERKAEVKANAEARKSALKTQVQKVKDERKREVVERTDARLGELNERRLNHFSNVLAKLEDVLERVTSRADRAEGRGLDVTTVRTAISEALKAVENSRLAIQTQTGKTYTITVTSEGNLRVDVEKARRALHDDLAKVRETVKAAHDAVRRAAVALAQIPRVNETENVPPTNSGTPGNQ